MSQFLGVDIGTTRTKVACYDTGVQGLVALRHEPTVEARSDDGPERDAVALAGTVRRMVAEILDDPAVDPGTLEGVSVGSVGEEVVLLDDDDRPVGPVLCWYADHGPSIHRELAAAGTVPDMAGLDPSYSVFKLGWLARHRPDQVVRARSWTSLADYVVRSLLATPGGRVVLNRSHASRTGVLDVATGTASPGVLADLGLAELPVPELVDSGEVIGTTGAGGPLPAGLPVVSGGHDHFCGAFGAGVRAAGQAYVSAGTSEAQFVLVDSLPEHLPDDLEPGIFVASGLRYVHHGTPAGQYYRRWHTMLYDGVPDTELWAEIETVADTVDAAVIDIAAGRCTMPAFPVGVQRGHLMAALNKGLARLANTTSAILERESRMPITEVTVAGVATTSATWRRLRREASARRLRFVAEPEATVLGVALLAQHGVTGTADTPATFVA